MLINLIKKVRGCLTFWVAISTVTHLKSIRFFEYKFAKKYFPAKLRNVVEIGGGAGWQAEYLKKSGFNIRSFDLKTSNYNSIQNNLVEQYDGLHLPIEDDSVDMVFSSNVLEHCADLKGVLNEHSRILNEKGLSIHLMPTPTWRLWTSITDLVIKFYFSKPHGEFSPNVFIEMYDFSERAWRARFNQNQYTVINVIAGRLFYTGNSLFDSRLNLKLRRVLSYFLGSSVKLYIVKPINN
jgi:SAM-dependent methyltransferase